MDTDTHSVAAGSAGLIMSCRILVELQQKGLITDADATTIVMDVLAGVPADARAAVRAMIEARVTGFDPPIS